MLVAPARTMPARSGKQGVDMPHRVLGRATRRHCSVSCSWGDQLASGLWSARNERVLETEEIKQVTHERTGRCVAVAGVWLAPRIQFLSR